MNTDAEQSGADATYYVQRLRDAWGSSNVSVHGIAGDAPGGCKGEIPVTQRAESSSQRRPRCSKRQCRDRRRLPECLRPGLGAHGEALAEACAAWRGFYFPQAVGPNRIDVYVDDVPQASGLVL
jgi:hypothetical protein